MKPQCNSTCQHACGCLCDRTPGAAVPVHWPPHDGRVSQIQCDRGPLDAWHDAQEQEAEDAAWRKQLWRDGLRDVARFAWKYGKWLAAGLIVIKLAAVIYSRMA